MRHINGRACFFCKRSDVLHTHHIFGGAYKKRSERYGFLVYLCPEHHTGDQGVHFDIEKEKFLKRGCQRRFERLYGTREEFMKEFGKNYL